jgi:LacI family transcriptional regulator
MVRTLTAKIGVVGAPWAPYNNVPSPTDNWPDEIFHSFEIALAAHPGLEVHFRNVPLHSTEDFSAAYAGAVLELFDEGLDALALILPPDEAELDSIAGALDIDRIPVVVAGARYLESRRWLSVFYEGGDDGYQACKHLHERGYRNISFFAPFSDDFGRLVGIQDAMREQGLELSDPFVSAKTGAPPPGELQEEVAYQSARSFLKFRQDPWGIIAANDHAGHGLMRAASEIGWEPGRDFGLIGFDDLSESRRLGMTSMHPPLGPMGSEAANLILRHLQGDCTTTEVRLRSHLIPRNSTQAPENQAKD